MRDVNFVILLRRQQEKSRNKNFNYYQHRIYNEEGSKNRNSTSVWVIQDNALLNFGSLLARQSSLWQWPWEDYSTLNGTIRSFVNNRTHIQPVTFIFIFKLMIAMISCVCVCGLIICRHVLFISSFLFSLLPDIVHRCPFLHRTAGDTERRYHLRYYKTCMCVHGEFKI